MIKLLLLFNLSFASLEPPYILEVEQYCYSFVLDFKIGICHPFLPVYCIVPIYPCTPINLNYITPFPVFIRDYVASFKEEYD